VECLRLQRVAVVSSFTFVPAATALATASGVVPGGRSSRWKSSRSTQVKSIGSSQWIRFSRSPTSESVDFGKVNAHPKNEGIDQSCGPIIFRAECTADDLILKLAISR
jgi:hypothetical protein